MFADEEIGAIVTLLCDENIVSEEQVAYALRIRKKLSGEKPLLGVLLELEYVSDEEVKRALRKRRVDVRVGDLLVELGYLQPQDLRVALDLQQEESERKLKLGEVLVEHHFVDERKLTEILATQLGFELAEPRVHDLGPELLSRTNPAWMAQNEFFPIRVDEDEVVIAFADPLNPTQLAAARTAFGEDLVPAIAPRSAILGAIAKIDPRGRVMGVETDEVTITRSVDAMLDAAIERGASDIHIEPMADRIRVRFREDGVLVAYREFPQQVRKALSNRIKVMCDANIAEHRRHQDARLFYTVGDHEFDMRVSIYVTIYGEKIVMRLLNRSREIVGLAEIGMAPHVLDRFLYDALDRPSGVILVTGPTGSGKTSTLYSCVNHIIDSETSIITAEDPVEYVIEGISQCSIDPSVDRGFDSTLKQIVRQDPDVIVIGEIRDAFSANTAIQAALTGHKVLTTFHTEDTIGGLMRLLNMDIEAFLVSSTVVSVLAQRLLRRICESCAAPYSPTPSDLRRLGYTGNELAGAEMRMGRGCGECRHTGYRGRLPIFELLVVDSHVRDSILNRQTAHQIRSLARSTSEMLSLLEDGIVKASRGLTTVHEIARMLPRLDRPRPLRELERLTGDFG